MKPIRWLGDTLNIVRDLSPEVRNRVGSELRYVQQGEMPSDWKPMATVGAGAEELRVWSEQGTFRVVYLARLPEAVFVLHAFQKKTQATPKADIDLAARRYRDLMRTRP